MLRRPRVDLGKKVVTHKDLAGDITAGKTLKSVETSDRSAPLTHAGAGLAHVKHGLVHGVQIFQHSLMKAVARGPEAPLNSVETRDKSAPQLDAAVSAPALRVALCTSPCSFRYVLCAVCLYARSYYTFVCMLPTLNAHCTCVLYADLSRSGQEGRDAQGPRRRHHGGQDAQERRDF